MKKIPEEKYNKIRQEITKMVKKACYSPNNYFTETVWDHHILPVVEISLVLGRKLKANLQVLELSALLHDYACVINKDWYKEHHKHGARLAGELLGRYDLSAEMLEHIQSCIYCHRASVQVKRESIEAEILASADAMSHITELADMMYYVFGVLRMKTKEGSLWLKKKLERDWAKIMPTGRKMIEKDYNTAMEVIAKAIK